MIRTTLAASGVCALVTVALSAQTTPAPSATPSRMDMPQTMTLTGCLKPWDASTMGAPAAAERGMAAATTAQQYVLTNAEQGPATTPTPAGTTAGSPTPPSGGGSAMGAHSTYLLKAQTPSVNFASHVGHKVEVTGTLAMDKAKSMGEMGSGATGTTPAMPGTPATGTSATPGSATTGMQHGAMTDKSAFTVTALKMIDKTCS